MEAPVLTDDEAYAKLCEGLAPRSLMTLSLDNPVRKWTIKVIKSKIFERTILSLILFNCIFLAMSSNEDGFEDTTQGKVIEISEYIFTVLFVGEMCLKIVGLGFYFGDGTYLKDGWNVMDFMVVILGLLSLTPFVDNLSAIRTVRVLRPLRTITGVEGMRVLVITLLNSLPMLFDVFVLVSFAFFIFGIVGVQLFAGKMDHRCGHLVVQLDDGAGNISLATAVAGCEDCGVVEVGESGCDSTCAYEPETMFWVVDDDDSDDLCTGPKGGYPFHGSGGVGKGRGCAPGYWCVEYENPNFNITNFDNILLAWLTIFQCISLEGWTDIMYWVKDGVNPYVWIYFTIMIVFGSFFAVNLALAVLYLYFTTSADDPEEESSEEEKDAEGKPEGKAEGAALGGAEAADGGADGDVPVTSPRSDGPIVRFCFYLANASWFEILTMSLIIFNTVIMASEYHSMPKLMSDIYDVINYVLSGYFGLECIIKITGLGLREYMRDQMNTFDGLVVVFSFVEIAINATSKNGGNNSLSVLRSFRLLRVFKLARSWKQLNQIISTIFKSLSSISYLSLILLLFIFIFSLLGMQLFGYMFIFCEFTGIDDATSTCPYGEDCPSHPDCYVPCDAATQGGLWVDYLSNELGSFGEPSAGGMCRTYTDDETGDVQSLVKLGYSYYPRHNFDDIYWSVITIFQILTGENWNEVMYDGIRATTWAASLYFLLLVIVGNYIILNLFLAILLDNFGGADDEDEDEEEDGAEKIDDGPRYEITLSYWICRCFGRPDAAIAGPTSEPAAAAAGDAADTNPPPSINSFLKDAGEGEEGEEKSAAPPASPRAPSVVLNGNSLGFLSPTNPVRLFLAQIVCHKYFEYVIITLICLSSIVLAIDSPQLDQDGELKKALDLIDKIFVVAFCCELSLKVTVLGFALHPGSYIRNSWNILDFLIVIVGLVGWFSDGDQLSALRALRTFRALRPIRMASRAEGMKVVVNALFQAIPGIANVSFVCLLFYLIFGILGLNLFMGKYFYCEDEDSGEPLDPYALDDFGEKITKEWCDMDVHYSFCVEEPGCDAGHDCVYRRAFVGEWTCSEVTGAAETVTYEAEMMRLEKYGGARWSCTNADASETKLSFCEPTSFEHSWTIPSTYDFDNIGSSVLALFEMATLEGWLVVMYSGVDAAGEDKHPVRDYNPSACVFFVIFIIVGSFFVMNLFVGVTIDKFNEMKEKQEGKSVFLTAEQRNWVAIQKLLVDIKPVKSYTPPSHPLRRQIFDVVVSDPFDAFILSMIMLKVVVMAMTHADDDDWETGLFIANTTFGAIFLVEAASKIFALGPRAYFTDSWSLFDFVVVMLSIVGFIITVTPSLSTNASYLGLIRIFRVARIFRLIPKAKGLRTLFQTLVYSLPALVNVGSVLFLFFFIFSIMGMTLFGRVAHGDFVHRHANFENFPNALLLLFRMATGESWNGLMHDCMVEDACYLIEEGENEGLYVAKDAPELDGLKEFDEYENICPPHKIVTIFYFIVFVILCAFVMLNLVIAVILDNFQNSNQSEDAQVGQEHVLRFCEVWSKLDPGASYYISAAKLQYLVSELDPPLGTKGSGCGKTEIQTIIMSVDIPNHQGAIHFLETLHALAGRIAGTELPEDEEVKIRGKIADRLPVFKDASGVPKYTAAHYHAALYVQAAIRGFLARYQMRSKLATVDAEGDASM